VSRDYIELQLAVWGRTC